MPFVAGYRPLAIGLGTLAVDLFLLVVVTSLLRNRLPLRLWKAVHLTSYLLWPLAFVHGVTAGTDLGGGWLLVLVLGCAVAATWSSVTALGPALERSAAGGARGRRPHRHLRRPLDRTLGRRLPERMTAMTAPSRTRGLLDAPGPSLREHLAAHGPLPVVDLHTLVEEAALIGRGGAGFPTAAKLRSVAAAAGATRRAPVVVANGSEGSRRPRRTRPCWRWRRTWCSTGWRSSPPRSVPGPPTWPPTKRQLPALSAHLAERRDPVRVRLHAVAEAFLAGEESALLRRARGEARPAADQVPARAGAGRRRAARPSSSTSRPSRAWR